MSATLGKNLFSLVAKRLQSLPVLALPRLSALSAIRAETGRPASCLRYVELDPALAARILTVVNSPFYGLRSTVSTLSHAAAVLGRDVLEKLAMGTPSAQLDDAGLKSYLRIWQHSVAAAVTARAVAEDAGYDLPEEAYVAGLLHDIGKVLVATYAPEAYGRELDDQGVDVHGPPILERAYLGMEHPQVGALVAQSWGLPRHVRDAIRYHHNVDEQFDKLPKKTRELVRIVATADRVAWSSGHGITAEDDCSHQASSCGGRQMVSRRRLDAVRARVEEALERIYVLLDVSCPDPAERLDALLAAEAEAAEELPLRIRRPSLATRLRGLNSRVHRLRSRSNVQEMIAYGVAGVQADLDFDRVAFLQADVDEGCLQARCFEDGALIRVNPHEIRLSLGASSSVNAALRDGTAARVDDRAADGELLERFGAAEAAVAPVVVNSQPLGILYADDFFGCREFTDEDLSVLAIAGTTLAMSLESHVLSQQAAKLRGLAAKDELTGLLNRRSLMALLQKEIDRAKRYESSLSVVMLDIDDFKLFNDVYGHQAGDAVLVEVAQRIVSASRDVDGIGRYGGEEFVVVLPETTMDEAIVYAERLRTTIENLGAQEKETYPDCVLTISAGVTCLLGERDGIEQIVQRVDLALYAAKQRGRNRVCMG